MRKFIVLLSVFALILVATGCGGASTPPQTGGTDNTGNQNNTTGGNEQAREKYIIGTDVTFPPFEYEENGKMTGFDIELINAIADEEGFDIELKPMNFQGIIPGITSGQLDAGIAGMTITDERKEVVDFSDVYYMSGLSLVVHKDNTDINGLEDLAGKKVAIKQGTTGAIFGEKAEKEYGAQVVYFDSSPNMFQEVVNKNADATFEDYPVINYMIHANPDMTLKIVEGLLEEYPTGIAVSKDKPELLEKINSGLAKLKENGTYDKLIEKYME